MLISRLPIRRVIGGRIEFAGEIDEVFEFLCAGAPTVQDGVQFAFGGGVEPRAKVGNGNPLAANEPSFGTGVRPQVSANDDSLHARFEKIHSFQNGNGRIGRLILLKECLKYAHTPFVIAENLRQFYYLGFGDWRQGRSARLIDTCRTGQDVFIRGLKQFGHVKLAEKAAAQVADQE